MNESPDTSELERIQQWLQTVIVHPAGVEAGIASDEARAQFDVSPEDVEQVALRSRNLTSVERLQIYSHAYFARLADCLREEFPAFTHAVGDEAFGGFVAGYLQAYPSQRYTLAELGRHFPLYLAATRPADEKGETRPNWADFVIELAVVECAYSEVFDGPGVEHARVLEASDLTAIPPERCPETRLIPVPCLRLFTLGYPVHEYITAVRKQQAANAPTPNPTHLIVTRRNYLVRRCAVPADEFALLKLLVEGATLGAALETWAERSDGSVETLEENLRQWFQSWAAAAYFQAVE